MYFIYDYDVTLLIFHVYLLTKYTYLRNNSSWLEISTDFLETRLVCLLVTNFSSDERKTTSVKHSKTIYYQFTLADESDISRSQVKSPEEIRRGCARANPRRGRKIQGKNGELSLAQGQALGQPRADYFFTPALN